jgi:CHRD domain
MPVFKRLLTVLVLAAALVALGAAPAGAQDESTPKCLLFTTLTPGEEVPPTTSRAFGFTVVHIEGTTLRFSTLIVNLARETFIAGHIHVGAAGVNGPVVVSLFTGPSDARFIAQAESREISLMLAGQICDDPGPAGFYVNYHTTAFPGGAIRGQLG